MGVPSRFVDEPPQPQTEVRATIPRARDVEIGVSPYGKLLHRRRFWLGGCALAGAVLGGTLALLQPTIYEGVSTLIVAQPKFSADAKPVTVSNFRVMIETNSIASAAIKKFDLDKPPYRFTPARLRRDALIIEEVRNTNLIRARVRLRDAKLAADVANFIATEAIAFNDRMDSQETRDFRNQLRTQLDEAQRRLQSAEQRLLEFRSTAQLDLMQRDADSALDQRGELLNLAVEIESEKAKLASAEEEIKRQQPVLTTPRNVGAEAALRATPGAEVKEGSEVDASNPFVNPVYQVLDYQIALSRTRLASLQRRRTELIAVQHVGGRELKPLTELYPQEIQLRRLEADHDLASTLYEEVAHQYERARLQIVNSSARLQLVDTAVESDTPLPRHRGLYTLLGLIAGCAVGVLAVIVIQLERAAR